MLQITGILIVGLGFFVHVISFVYIPPIIFFGLGFLFILQPNNQIPYLNSFIKPARLGLFINVLSVVFATALYSYLLYLLPANEITSGFYRLFSYIVNPVGTIAEIFFPQSMQTLEDGRVIYTYTLIRVSTESLFNLILYIVVSVIASSLLKAKKQPIN